MKSEHVEPDLPSPIKTNDAGSASRFWEQFRAACTVVVICSSAVLVSYKHIIPHIQFHAAARTTAHQNSIQLQLGQPKFTHGDGTRTAPVREPGMLTTSVGSPRNDRDAAPRADNTEYAQLLHTVQKPRGDLPLAQAARQLLRPAPGYSCKVEGNRHKTSVPALAVVTSGVTTIKTPTRQYLHGWCAARCICLLRPQTDCTRP